MGNPSLKGRTVLVTGGARRIGREICREFALRGAHVAIHCHRSQKEAASLSKELQSLRVRSAVFSADLQNTGQIRLMTKKILKTFGPIDILVNNASAFFPTDNKGWEKLFLVNAMAPLALIRLLAPSMKKRGWGRIINIADRKPHDPRFFVYGMTKAALLSLTEGLAKQFAPEILVAAVCPGLILPPEHLSAEARKRLAGKIPLQRWGGAEEIALAVVFLAESNFITGTSLIIDGGETLRPLPAARRGQRP